MNIESILKGSDESLKLLKEVEESFGSKVELKLDAESEGALYIKPNFPFPTIFYREESQVTISACVHELLHLRLVSQGCPFAVLRDSRENNEWLRASVNLLNNLFQHAIIFPELVKRGFSPYESEEAGLESQLEGLSKPNFAIAADPPKVPFGLLSSLRAIVALIYSRAFLDCISEHLRSRCLALFSEPSFIESRSLGEKVITLVQQYAIRDFSVFQVGLIDAIDVLKQSNSICISKQTALNNQNNDALSVDRRSL